MHRDYRFAVTTLARISAPFAELLEYSSRYGIGTPTRKRDTYLTSDNHNSRNMAEIFNAQGQYEKALQWYQRALDGYEKNLGKDHPSILKTIRNIAGISSKQK
jgi:tetratricopeptide (TPR) repeat protein